MDRRGVTIHLLCGEVRPVLCVFLATLIGMQTGFAQAPQNPPKPAEAQPAQAPQNPPKPADVQPAPAPLNVSVIEGNNAINSIPLGRSVTPVVEVRDQNDFPVEGATVVFTLPASGPGGTFLKNPTVFTTLTDAHGQASAPFTVNGIPGKFQLQVTATLGNRRGEAVVTQTNTTGGYIGPAMPHRSWYSKWTTWAIIGGAATAGIVAWAVTRSSSSKTAVTLTPGAPVFH